MKEGLQYVRRIRFLVSDWNSLIASYSGDRSSFCFPLSLCMALCNRSSASSAVIDIGAGPINSITAFSFKGTLALLPHLQEFFNLNKTAFFSSFPSTLAFIVYLSSAPGFNYWEQRAKEKASMPLLCCSVTNYRCKNSELKYSLSQSRHACREGP